MRTLHVRPGAPASTVILEVPNNALNSSSSGGEQVSRKPPAFFFKAVEQGMVWALIVAIAFVCVVIREEAGKLPREAARPAEVQSR